MGLGQGCHTIYDAREVIEPDSDAYAYGSRSAYR
jgi:hypothetical protein